MEPLENDIWKGVFVVDKAGAWRYTLLGWIDHFATWAGDLQKRLAAQTDAELAELTPGLDSSADSAAQDIALALASGALLVRDAAGRVEGSDAGRLLQVAQKLERLAGEKRPFCESPCDEELQRLMGLYPDLTHATQFDVDLPVQVDRERARSRRGTSCFRGLPRQFPDSTEHSRT